jgi:hypothetical protein
MAWLTLIPPVTLSSADLSLLQELGIRRTQCIPKASLIKLVLTWYTAKGILGVRGLYSTEMEAIHLLWCDTSAMCIQTIALLSSCVY